jgi:hypothetical protein
MLRIFAKLCCAQGGRKPTSAQVQTILVAEAEDASARPGKRQQAGAGSAFRELAKFLSGNAVTRMATTTPVITSDSGAMQFVLPLELRTWRRKPPRTHRCVGACSSPALWLVVIVMPTVLFPRLFWSYQCPAYTAEARMTLIHRIQLSGLIFVWMDSPYIRSKCGSISSRYRVKSDIAKVHSYGLPWW